MFRKMKKIIKSMFFLLFVGVMSLSVNAQVTIGSDAPPHPGAILDLSPGNNLGLLLPRVWLDDVGAWTHDGRQALGGDKLQAAGMMVYNTNICINGGDGSGVYVWDGSAWAAVFSSAITTPSPYEPEMVCVAGGVTNLNGVDVTLNSFYIGKYEVTQKQWYDVMGSWPGNAPSSARGVGDNFPMYNVSWNDIVGTGGTMGYTINGIEYKTDGFCYKLSQLVGGGKKYRLPTEAEWEYAAKGGQQAHIPNYTYAGSDIVDDVAWYKNNSSGTSHIVGAKAANELGIYDMSGNVWEWCRDWYVSTAPYPSGTDNPTGAPSGSNRAYRGGSWNYTASLCTISFRGGSTTPPTRFESVGFRLVLVP
jgi:formylglycine-generating enzyme required for sulfatase activity